MHLMGWTHAVSFDDLPAEVYEQICLQFNVRDLLRVSRLNKKFYLVAHSDTLWKHLCFEQFERYPPLDNLWLLPHKQSTHTNTRVPFRSWSNSIAINEIHTTTNSWVETYQKCQQLGEHLWLFTDLMCRCSTSTNTDLNLLFAPSQTTCRRQTSCGQNLSFPSTISCGATHWHHCSQSARLLRCYTKPSKCTIDITKAQVS
jgi:hypothetical protein